MGEVYRLLELESEEIIMENIVNENTEAVKVNVQEDKKMVEKVIIDTNAKKDEIKYTAKELEEYIKNHPKCELGIRYEGNGQFGVGKYIPNKSERLDEDKREWYLGELKNGKVPKDLPRRMVEKDYEVEFCEKKTKASIKLNGMILNIYHFYNTERLRRYYIMTINLEGKEEDGTEKPVKYTPADFQKGSAKLRDAILSLPGDFKEKMEEILSALRIIEQFSLLESDYSENKSTSHSQLLEELKAFLIENASSRCFQEDVVKSEKLIYIAGTSGRTAKQQMNKIIQQISDNSAVNFVNWLDLENKLKHDSNKKVLTINKEKALELEISQSVYAIKVDDKFFQDFKEAKEKKSEQEAK